MCDFENDEDLRKRIKLIQEVKKRPGLWDRNRLSPIYVRKQLWKEIAKVFQISEERVRKTWINLRTIMGKEHLRHLRSGPLGAEMKSEWPFFNEMSFLSDHLAHLKKKRGSKMASSNSRSKIKKLKISSASSEAQIQKKSEIKDATTSKPSTSNEHTLSEELDKPVVLSKSTNVDVSDEKDDDVTSNEDASQGSSISHEEVEHLEAEPPSCKCFCCNQKDFHQTDEDKANMYFFMSFLPKLKLLNQHERLVFITETMNRWKKIIENAS